MDTHKPTLSYARPKPRRPWFEPALFALTTGFLGAVCGVIFATLGWYAFSIFHPEPLMQYDTQEAALILTVIGVGGVIGLVVGATFGALRIARR
ncbi:MAG TPA: hypothetical protein VGI81_24240 [Tepidisphaeraceae bacterium]